ncbi:hypothetical protein IPA_08125 [Ignicoccus pacificus DSM 13166]|uniref:Uncharacterized protein n=1 Tax=Ignicoccus pacificus DSM 13166 TaxID=940294 RepID=A0A977PL99_9CREN|nr:hypothetical protein IPA_08125 [Ignicoccus pacificus DSM 13166]
MGLSWNPPEGPVEFLGGSGRLISLDEIMYKCDVYKVKHVVFDGPLDYEVAEELVKKGFYVSVRYVEPIDLPEEVAMLLVPKEKAEIPEGRHVELVIREESQLPEDLSPEVPIHVFDYHLYERLSKKFHYVYNHTYPLREDTRCPKCNTPNAIREMGRLVAWDGPRCRKCGYELHYHLGEIPKPPKRLLEALSWQASFVVI